MKASDSRRPSQQLRQFPAFVSTLEEANSTGRNALNGL
jgi:hypothetical protein